MVSPRAPSLLRERTRLAVRAELIEVGQRLFVRQGYENTTVEQIAAAAGMSKRSFFRYFETKEDIVLGKYERSGQQFCEALSARPAEEDLWTSMRHVFGYVVQYAADPAQAASMLEMERIFSSDKLRGAYLARIEVIQRDLVEVARRRAAATGRPWAADDPTPIAIVACAFACLRAANDTWRTSGGSLGPLLDRAMAAVVRER